ncbi:unnamed protein product [Spirodela intermedia]|uniref:Reverse transcriptase domain-containing protein n=1 Tax=Spirodela intermedia TaxID=51605 RepID=A0A7I8J0B5_SPIIN|nr:unnamed protein product [Spirodela intermedia]CAA6662871.1 unnamed protein product [Spirodela intermedia]
MNQIFQCQLRRFILVLFDDILVYSITMAEHLQHMRKVFSILSTNSLHINAKKCRFEESKQEYLGIGCRQDWPIARNLKKLRGFLGLTGYYRKFITNYALIAWPLTQLLRKDAFYCITLPNFSQEFIVKTDASGSGVGAILLQQGRPIAYFSQALPRKAKLKSAYERELMGVMLAVRKWRHYLMYQHFIIKSD